MELHKRALKNFKGNPEKTFFYSLTDSYNGKLCQKKILEYVNILENIKVKSVAINLKNSIDWVLWYIASDYVCKHVYLISSDFSNSLTNKIIQKYNIDLLIRLENGKISLHQPKDSPFSCYLNSTDRSDIIFTSGTTGIPKGAVISEKSFLHVSNELIKKTEQNENDLELLSMPLDRSFGLARLRTCLLSGSSCLITDGLKDFPSIYRFSKEIKITGISLVPSALQIIILQLRKKSRVFTENIKYFELGSSSLIEEQEEWIKNNFENTIILHHYGMTESSRAFLKRLDIKKNLPKRFVGKPLNGVKFKINMKGHDNNEEGELLLKGKNLFSGYLEDFDNKSKLKDGWFRTGDICLQKNDKVYLIGRSDNQINIGGVKIQAEKIEEILESMECVEESICFQIPDKILGNSVAAILKLSSKTEDIKKYIEEVFKNFPQYYRPTKIQIVDSIPKTFNGKKLRDQNLLVNFLK